MIIGNLDLGSRLFLAPMAEISDAPFRKIARKYGAGLTFTQMVSARGIVENNFQSLKFLSFSRDEKPLGVQILGNNSYWLCPAVKEISKLKPDLIDLNCGCPMEKVTKHNMGASLLQNPEKLGALIKSMVEVSEGIPISAKIRLGINRNSINVSETAKAIEEAGASLIFVHARAKTDKYDNEAMWEWLSRVKSQVSIPVVGNGSVFDYRDAADMIKNTGCDSALVARGALGNPFIFRNFNDYIEKGNAGKEVTIDDVYGTLLEHISLIEAEYDYLTALHNAKKHSIWYLRKFQGISELLNTIFSFGSLEELKKFLRDHTEKVKSNSYPHEDLETIDKKFKNKVLFWLYNPNLYSMRVAG